MHAGDIMSEDVICVDQGASIFDAAELLSRELGNDVGNTSDKELRHAVEMALEKHRWHSRLPTNIVVNAGVVHLWEFVPGKEVRKAYRVAAENVPGVKRVKCHLRPLPAAVGMGV